MKRVFGTGLAMLFGLFLMTGTAHEASVTIAAPTDGQVFVVDFLPATVTVEGTITHGSPGNVNDQDVCVFVDGVQHTCAAGPTGVGTQTSYNYSVQIELGLGVHAIQVRTDKPEGGHSGQSDTISIEVVLSDGPCDEVDPPAHANQYLNALNPPKAYARYRGQILRVIANNHSNGVYGSCTFDYSAVEQDVNALLQQLGWTP